MDEKDTDLVPIVIEQTSESGPATYSPGSAPWAGLAIPLRGTRERSVVCRLGRSWAR